MFLRKILELLKNVFISQINRRFFCELFLQIIVIVLIIAIQYYINPDYKWAIPSEIIFSLFSVVGSISIELHFENKETKAYAQKKVSSYVIVLSGALLTVFSLLFYVLGKVIPARGINIAVVILLVFDFIYYCLSFYIRKTIEKKQKENKLEDGVC